MHPHALGFKDAHKRAQGGGLPRPGAPRQDRELVAERVSDGILLEAVEGEAGLGLGPHQGRVDLDGRQPARDPQEPGDHIGDLPLVAVVRRELDEPRARKRRLDARRKVPDQALRSHQGLYPRRHQGGRGVEHLGRMVPERFLAERRMPLLLERLHGEEDPRLEPRRRVVREAEVDRDLVGRLEADPLDLPGDTVGLVRQDSLGLRAVLLDELHALARAHPVGLQKDIEFALGALAVPGLLDRGRALAPDPGHVPQAPRLLAQDAEGVGAEDVDDLVRVDPADPGDQPAPQVLADPVHARRELAPERRDLELGAVGGVPGPLSREVERLATFDPGEGPHDRHRLRLGGALPRVRPELGYGVVVLLVEEDDALDDSSERGGFGGGGHVRQNISRAMVENPAEINGACSPALIRAAKAVHAPAMFRRACALLAIVALASGARAQEAAAADEAEIRQLNADYVKAYLACDVARFRTLLADDFTGVLADGRVIDKAEFLRLAKQPPDARGLRLHDLVIHAFGDTVVAGAMVTYTRANGAAVRTRYSTLYIRRDGQWAIHWTQWTRLSAP